jgi:ATP-dependent DNA helicase RecQ
MIDTQSDSAYKKLAFDKLEATSRFSSSEICRHVLIAEYFDDHSQPCITQCDNCTLEDKKSIDITQDVL